MLHLPAQGKTAYRDKCHCYRRFYDWGRSSTSKNGLKAPRLSVACCFWDGGHPLSLSNATFAMHHDNLYRVIIFAWYRATRSAATPNSNTNTPFGFAERGVEASHGLDLTLHNWSRGQNAIENKSESESKRWEVEMWKKKCLIIDMTVL